MSMNVNVIEKLISVAREELGYLEKASNSNLYNKTANAGYKNFTKYWQDIKPSWQGQPWCAVFVTWCFEKAFGKENARKLLKHYPYTYCPTMANLFTLNANPKMGDIVIFKYNGEFAHTGIVIKVNGDYFETIEGNTNNGNTIVPNGGSVCKKSYYNSKLPGTKFCTPNWSLINSIPSSTTSKNWIVELQAECNRQGFSKQVVDGIPGPNTLNGCPMLQVGASGKITRILQQRLTDLGFNTKGVDGIFGQNTKQAVMNFQKSRKLSVDGIVGKNTWRKLLGL